MEEKEDKFTNLRDKDGVIILHDSLAEEENNYHKKAPKFNDDPFEVLKKHKSDK